MNRTTTQLVNEIRLEQAARQLGMTDRPIIEIALDCDFDNLGYFYRRFSERFSITPRQYRLTRQAVVR